METDGVWVSVYLCEDTRLKNVFVHAQVPSCECYLLLVIVEMFPSSGLLDGWVSEG